MVPIGNGNGGGAGAHVLAGLGPSPTLTVSQSWLALVTALTTEANIQAANASALRVHHQHDIIDNMNRDIRDLRNEVSKERSAKNKAIQDMPLVGCC